ncbi:MAG: DUF4864 domain-containing protein [Shimia sp.]|uniref:DUF4864 domain-containing protein n=1 Tax=Shimia sp. TaxID=1954381 RepID=UPI004059857B
MRQMLLAILIAVGFAFGAGAEQNGEDGVAPQIEAVIHQQMQAFQGDDYAAAFGYAADNIRRMFGTAENFGEMVKRGYPMVHRPAEVRFGAMRQDGGAIWQRVLVRDGAGAFFSLDYLMVPTEAGWRIAAVSLKGAPESA